METRQRRARAIVLVAACAWTIVGCERGASCGAGTVLVAGRCEVAPSDAGAPDAEVPLEGDAAMEPDAGPPPLGPDVHEIAGLGDDADESLRALDAIVGEARFVGLGETVHTVGGYYRAKNRIIRYLIEHLGFRAVAIESNWQAADRIADYVAECESAEGSEDAVRSAVFGVWSSVELAELAAYMCEWNLAHPDDRVTFFGFDVQQPFDDMQALRTELPPLAGDEASALLAPLERCHGTLDARAELSADRDAHAACTAGLEALDAWIDGHEEAIRASVGADALSYLRLRVLGIGAWDLQVYTFDGVPGGEPDTVASLEARDRGMATSLRELARLRAPDARVAVWAHNTHLAQQQDRVRGYYGGARSMGTFLRAELAGAYVAIALAGYHVSLDWPGVLQGALPDPTDEQLIEVRAHALGRPLLLIETNRSDLGARAFFAEGESYRLRAGGSSETMVPGEQFDAIFYLENADAMTPLLW